MSHSLAFLTYDDDSIASTTDTVSFDNYSDTTDPAAAEDQLTISVISTRTQLVLVTTSVGEASPITSIGTASAFSSTSSASGKSPPRLRDAVVIGLALVPILTILNGARRRVERKKQE